MSSTRKSDRIYATANGIAEAALDGTVNMYMPGTDGGEGHVWAVDSSTMNGIRQNLLSVGQICKQIGYCMFLRGHDKYVPPPMRKILPKGWEGFIRYRADSDTYDMIPVFWDSSRRLYFIIKLQASLFRY